MSEPFPLTVKTKAKTGRPRKEGKREPSGRLSRAPQRTPEDLVRMALIESLLDTRHHGRPLDTLYSRGLIDQRALDAGIAYADAYYDWKAVLDGTMPRVTAVGLRPAPERETEILAKLSPRQRDAAIAAIWDRFFSWREGGEARREAREERVAARWRTMNRAMTDAQRYQVFSVCVLEANPKWLQRSDEEAAASRGRSILVAGLMAVAGAFWAARSAAPATRIEPLPDPRAPLPAPARSNGVVEYVIARPDDEPDEDEGAA